jgi:hypothetical protein
MRFFADYAAQRGFNLLASHGLVESLIDERLIASLSGLRLEERNNRTIQHD